jgi:hypothetical protein
MLVKEGSNETIAVFVSNSALTSVTPGTFSNALRMVIGQNLQVMPGTSKEMVFVSAALELNDNVNNETIINKIDRDIIDRDVLNIVNSKKCKYLYVSCLSKEWFIQKRLSRNKET